MKTLLIKNSDNKLVNINLEQTFVLVIEKNKDGYFLALGTDFSYKSDGIYIDEGLTYKEAEVILKIILNAIIHDKSFIDLSEVEVD